MRHSHRHLVPRHDGECNFLLPLPSRLPIISTNSRPCEALALIWGKNFFIFKPDVPVDHEEYELKILARQHQFFGPFPLSYKDLADDEMLGVLTYVMNSVPKENMKPFGLAGEREGSKEDKAIVLKIMKLDPRDRPTARELLQDEWFSAS
jgi:serine/threonine protein kinase